jgi:hypothetical protein
MAYELGPATAKDRALPLFHQKTGRWVKVRMGQNLFSGEKFDDSPNCLENTKCVEQQQERFLYCW